MARALRLSGRDKRYFSAVLPAKQEKVLEREYLNDPRIRRPGVPAEEKRVNVKRRLAARPNANAGGDTYPYPIGPQEEHAHARDKPHTGAIFDRAGGKGALSDRDDANADEDASSPDDGADAVDADKDAPDAIQLRRVKR